MDVAMVCMMLAGSRDMLPWINKTNSKNMATPTITPYYYAINGLSY